MKFLWISLVLSTMLVIILAHEMTHLALATEPTGICIGICSMEGELYSPATAVGIHNSLSKDETLPWIVGWATGFAYVIYGTRKIDRLRRDIKHEKI